MDLVLFSDEVEEHHQLLRELQAVDCNPKLTQMQNGKWVFLKFLFTSDYKKLEKQIRDDVFLELECEKTFATNAFYYAPFIG